MMLKHFTVRSPLAAALFVNVFALSASFTAQANPLPPPSAGSLGNQLNQETQRAPSAPQEAPVRKAAADTAAEGDDRLATIRLERVVFEGAEVLTPEELNNVAAPWLQQDVTMADLRMLMATVEQAYQQRGYLAVSVMLPVQNMQNGELKLLITVGRYDTPAVHTNNPDGQAFFNQLVVRATCDQACDGQTLMETAQVDRALYLLNDLPGISAQGTLKAGTLPGTSLLDVNVAPIKKFGGFVEMNNHGNQYTGRNMLNAGAQLNSALLIGDQLALSGVSSLEAFDHPTGLQQLSSSYSFPVGINGTRLGGGYSHLEYQLNGEYKVLGAKGQADTAHARLSHPLWLSSQGRVDTQFIYEKSRYTDEYGALEKKKGIDRSTLDVSGNLYGDRNVIGWRLASTLGRLTLEDSSSQSFDRQTRKAAGVYNFHRLDVFGLQGLSPSWDIFGSFRGQVTNRNLDSSQMLLLGGVNGVRAFDAQIADASVDQGWQSSAELRYHVPVLGKRWTVAGFFDHAQGQVNHHPWADQKGSRKGTDTQVRMSGAGAYLSAALTSQTNLSLTYAKPLHHNLSKENDVDPYQLWLSLSSSF